MPEGTTLETTDAVLSDLSTYLRSVSEVTEVLTFAGTSSPIDFNGMVRHYYLRQGPNVGDIRVNLLPKEDRRAAESRNPAPHPQRSCRTSPSAGTPTSNWWKCRRARPSSAPGGRNLRRDAARLPNADGRSQTGAADDGRAKRAWSMSMTRSKTIRRNRSSSSTRKRLPCTASAPRPSPPPCDWPWPVTCPARTPTNRSGAGVLHVPRGIAAAGNRPASAPPGAIQPRSIWNG